MLPVTNNIQNVKYQISNIKSQINHKIQFPKFQFNNFSTQRRKERKEKQIILATDGPRTITFGFPTEQAQIYTNILKHKYTD